MNKKQELRSFIKKKAVLRKKIKLSSGRVSDFYIDLRKVSLSPKGVYLISHLIFNLIKRNEITAVGGPTLGADPIVSGVCYLAYKNNKKLKGFIIRKSPKKHGRQRLIEGEVLSSRDRVAIIDDVATSGYSLIKSIEVLKREKIKVAAAISVVDRQEGAEEALAAYRCPLISLFKKSDFL